MLTLHCMSLMHYPLCSCIRLVCQLTLTPFSRPETLSYRHLFSSLLCDTQMCMHYIQMASIQIPKSQIKKDVLTMMNVIEFISCMSRFSSTLSHALSPHANFMVQRKHHSPPHYHLITCISC